MRVSAINNTNFKQIVETFRKDKEESKENTEDKDTYEVTITYTETVRVPKGDKILQKINYVI